VREDALQGSLKPAIVGLGWLLVPAWDGQPGRKSPRPASFISQEEPAKSAK
jgi:hypothetical protein